MVNMVGTWLQCVFLLAILPLSQCCSITQPLKQEKCEPEMLSGRKCVQCSELNIKWISNCSIPEIRPGAWELSALSFTTVCMHWSVDPQHTSTITVTTETFAPTNKRCIMKVCPLTFNQSNNWWRFRESTCSCRRRHIEDLCSWLTCVWKWEQGFFLTVCSLY